MAERVYEGMFLLDSNRYARDPSGVSGRIGEIIEKCGGQLEVSRLWAEQKLAYQMGRARKGVYWLTYFKMDSNRLSELNRAAQLNGDIIRHLVLTLEPRLVETIIAHAKGEAAKAAPQEPAAKKPEENGEETAEPAKEAAAASE